MNKEIAKFKVDKLDTLKRLYTKEQLGKTWAEYMPNIDEMLKPYIINLGYVGDVELFQVCGDDEWSYITNRMGAEEALKARVETANKTQDE